MAKGRKTAALAALGLGAAALSGMFDKKKKDDKDSNPISKEEFLKMEAEDLAKERRTKADTTADASSGMAKDRLADMKTPIRNAPAKKAEAPVRKAPVRSNPATPAFSVPTPANRAESARLARLGGKDNSMMDELQGLGRLRENRGDMTETGSERIARKQVAAAGRMRDAAGMKKGGMVKSSASKRADGCAMRGKTKGRMV